MKIGICDDEMIIAIKLKKMVSEILQKQHIQAEIDVFVSVMKLIKNIDSYDGVFLDIEMPEIDGIYAGKKIKSIKPDCVVIMATGCEDRYREAFHIKADDFITKPFDKYKIEEAIDIIVNENRDIQTIQLYKDGIRYNIKQKDIIYIEAYDSYTQYYTKNNRFRSEKSLTKIEDELNNKSFFRLRREIVVNMKWIDKYENNCVHIKDRKVMPSRGKKKEFERAYVEFDLGYK